MRLLNLVEQHHRIRATPHRLGQLPAFLVADVARRRANQPRDAVPLAVLAHVNAHHRVVVVEQEFRQRARQFRLAHACWPQKQERANRTVRVLQTRPAAPHGSRHRPHRVLLPDHALVQPLFHAQQLLRLAFQQPRHRDARPARNHLCNLVGVHFFFEHRAAVGLQLTQLVFALYQLPFQVRQHAVAQPRRLFQRRPPFGLLKLHLRLVNLRLDVADGLNCVLLRLPARGQPVVLLAQVRQFLL